MASNHRGRFWGGDDSESDETSSTSSGDGSHDGGARPGAAAVKPSRWAPVESDSSSEDEGRVARSVKDRTFESLISVIRAINNHLKINNWVSVQEGEPAAVCASDSPQKP